MAIHFLLVRVRLGDVLVLLLALLDVLLMGAGACRRKAIAEGFRQSILLIRQPRKGTSSHHTARYSPPAPPFCAAEDQARHKGDEKPSPSSSAVTQAHLMFAARVEPTPRSPTFRFQNWRRLPSCQAPQPRSKASAIPERFSIEANGAFDVRLTKEVSLSALSRRCATMGAGPWRSFAAPILRCRPAKAMLGGRILVREDDNASSTGCLSSAGSLRTSSREVD